MVHTQGRTIFPSGFGLVEILVGVSLAVLIFVGPMVVMSRSDELHRESLRFFDSTLLLDEGMEAMRFTRDAGWSPFAALTVGIDYYLIWSGGAWVATTTPSAFIDQLFDRRVRLASVFRDPSSSDIVESGGAADADSRLVTVTVAWRGRQATTTRSVSTYLTKLF